MERLRRRDGRGDRGVPAIIAVLVGGERLSLTRSTVSPGGYLLLDFEPRR